MTEAEVLATKEAIEFRQRHGLSSDEPIMLESLLLKENVLTIFSPLSDNFSGMAIRYEDEKFMLINSNQTIGRQNFSIAHELYHLFVQKNFTPKLSCAGTFNKKDKVEYKADLFAVNLLLPESGLLSIIPNEEIIKGKSIGIRTLFKIGSYFQVSWDFTLNRLHDLNLISREYYNTAQKVKESSGIRKLAQIYGGDESLYISGNENKVIGEYAYLAKSLFEKEIISESNYAKMMSEIGVQILEFNDPTN